MPQQSHVLLRPDSALNACHDRSALDVLFVDLPCTTYELGRRFKSAWSFKRFLTPNELHLGFRYMVAALRAAGFTADIIYPSESGITTREALVDEVARRKPWLLGLTSYEGSLGETLEFIATVRGQGCAAVTCLGGHLATFSYAEILRDFPDLVDLVVLGEGERTVVEIARVLGDMDAIRDVNGIAYAADAGVMRTRPRPVERDLDALPFPVVGDVPADPAVPLFLTTSRGCYGRCTFCRSSYFGERWRPRDPAAVVDEMEQAYRAGVRVFELVDDNFLGPGGRGKRRALAFADELTRRGLALRFHASCRVNDVDEATMRALSSAGLISLSLGVESGVPRMLETFNKRVTVEENEAALRLLDNLGIPTLAYVIFFDPYTTLDEVHTNLAFLRRVGSLDHVRFEEVIFRRLIPVSGTALFNQMRADGLLRGDYLSGHSFEFRDPRVALLADFIESVDLRIEFAFRDDAVRAIPGLYRLMKERVEFDFMERAVELLGAWPGPLNTAAGELESAWQEALRADVATPMVVGK